MYVHAPRTPRSRIEDCSCYLRLLARRRVVGVRAPRVRPHPRSLRIVLAALLLLLRVRSRRPLPAVSARCAYLSPILVFVLRLPAARGVGVLDERFGRGDGEAGEERLELCDHGVVRVLLHEDLRVHERVAVVLRAHAHDELHLQLRYRHDRQVLERVDVLLPPRFLHLGVHQVPVLRVPLRLLLVLLARRLCLRPRRCGRRLRSCCPSLGLGLYPRLGSTRSAPPGRCPGRDSLRSRAGKLPGVLVGRLGLGAFSHDARRRFRATGHGLGRHDACGLRRGQLVPPRGRRTATQGNTVIFL
ncbi:hypothetical protein T484DRAFT_2435094 [Baffinella frigidus]|nr:hypothetical protein T484DRAFT_2435094 [Cryptophyta sp. CCMP2293]